MSRPATSPMRRPTTVEPVKLTMSTCGEATRASPASAPAAGDDVDDAGREAGLDHRVGEPQHGEGVLGGRLDDHGVAHGQGRADLAGHVDQREVVRRDGGDDADRPALDHRAEQAAGGERGRGHLGRRQREGDAARGRPGRSAGTARWSGAPAWSWPPAGWRRSRPGPAARGRGPARARMSARRDSSADRSSGGGAAPGRERLGGGARRRRRPGRPRPRAPGPRPPRWRG